MSKVQRALNSAAIAIHNAGIKVAGPSGAMAAAAISDLFTGRHVEECSDECGWCDGSTDLNSRPLPPHS